jgi:Mg/Co/Ni transporter MgtE
MLTQDMLVGVLLGLVLAVVLGVVLWWLLWSRDHIRAFFAPQRAFTQMQTRRTPFQVLCGCGLGIAALALFFLALWVLVQELF